MKLTARTTFTLNNGPEQVRDILIDLPDERQSSNEDLQNMHIMTMAADLLIAEGQVMVSAVEVLEAAEAS